MVVPLVRITYGKYFNTINDPSKPPRLSSGVDYREAPPPATIPLFRGLSPALLERVLHEGVRPFLAHFSSHVTIGPDGCAEVSTELLRKLYSLLFLGDVSVTCNSAEEASIVNAISNLVKETGRELASMSVQHHKFPPPPDGCSPCP